MRLYDVRTEYQRNPIGIDVKKPRFSWKMESDKQDTVQEAYQIQVTQMNFLGNSERIVWNSGKVESEESVLVEYGGEDLLPRTEYRCKLSVWNNHEEKEEKETFFETGFFNPEHLDADWITHSFSENEKACPVFIKQFALKEKPVNARLYITSLGLYEACINEKKCGDGYFTPGWTSYNKRLQYQTYDVIEMLDISTELQELEITVADGWYKGPFGFTLEPNHYGDQVAVLAELHILYGDGTCQLIKTDNTWQVTSGTIRESQIYLGETIDSTFTKDALTQAQIYEYRKNHLIAQESELVKITKRTKAKKMILTPKGELVLDFGQNMTGFVEFEIKGKSGQKITIYHAETLDRHGNFYPDTLRQAISVDTYICNGKEQIFAPHFTFHGFRYIKIEGIEKEDIQLDKFNACTLHTDMEVTGDFICSDSRVNQLQSNIQWGMRSNFLDIPTDCPQRDERLGWTGDAQIFAATASYNMNTALFFKKWLRDLKADQTKKYGPPHVVPNILGDQAGAAAWSDAATIVPWVVYQTFGDKRVLEEQFDSMKDWVDYITDNCGQNGLWQRGFQYGDWLALDKEESADRTGATDKYLVANAYYAYSTSILVKTAKFLGYKKEEEKYKELYDKIIDTFNLEYITRTGRVVSETQTGCILPLHFNIAEDHYKERILSSLVQNIEAHKNHLSTGFVGTPYLCHVLSEHGNHDLAGTIFLQEDYPSWLYAIKKGATTIWERWNSIMPDGSFDESGMNSLNHYAYGSIGDWMYQKLAGINVLEPGYKRFSIRPLFIKGINYVKASYECVYGTIISEWECKDGKIRIRVKVPANTKAEIHLPEKEEVLYVGSGEYYYEYDTETNLERERFSMSSTLQAILEEPLGVELFNKYSPGALDGPMIQFAYQFTLAEMAAVAPEMSKIGETIVRELNEKLK